MHPIEYIGPRPKKPTRKSWGGGWLMIFFVVIGVGIAARPFISNALASRAPVTEQSVDDTVAWLGNVEGPGNQLAAAALMRTQEEVVYDESYYKISYPMGDVPENKGVSSDLVIRSYRSLGIDLQLQVHEDMQSNFRIYPQLWGLNQPDTNIDHRRIPNLHRYFSRHGEAIEFQDGELLASDTRYGDVVIWRLPHGDTHIGIVVPGPGSRKHEKWVVHNIGSGPQWENKLLDYQIVGQYRYHGGQDLALSAEQ